MRCAVGDVKTGGSFVTPGAVWEEPRYCPRGVRHRSGVIVLWASVWNVGICRSTAEGETDSKFTDFSIGIGEHLTNETEEMEQYGRFVAAESTPRRYKFPKRLWPLAFSLRVERRSTKSP